MINLVQFILKLWAISRPIKSTNEPIAIDDTQFTSHFMGSVKIDFGEIVYPNMLNETCMGEFGEIVISKPLCSSSYNPNYISPFHVIEFEMFKPEDVGCHFFTNCRIVEYFDSTNKKQFLLLIYPPFIFLYQFFSLKYRSYITNRLLLSNYLEQTTNILEYIFHNNIMVNNLFSNKLKINLLNEHCDYYENYQKDK